MTAHLVDYDNPSDLDRPSADRFERERCEMLARLDAQTCLMADTEALAFCRVMLAACDVTTDDLPYGQGGTQAVRDHIGLLERRIVHRSCIRADRRLRADA